MPKKKKAASKKIATIKKRTTKKTAPATQSPDKSLRKHLLELLKGKSAHADFDAAMGDWPAQLAGVKVANFPHTA